MSVKLKYTNHWPDREPSLYKSTASKEDVVKLIDKINWNKEAAMHLLNKSGTEIFVEGTIEGGLIITYTEKTKIFGTADEPFIEDIISICGLFAEGKKTWKTHMEFIYDRNVDGTIDTSENPDEERLVQAFNALNITHGYFGRDYKEINGSLHVTNQSIVFTNSYNYSDGLYLRDIHRFATDTHMFIDNVMILYNARNEYYKFVIKGGQRDTAMKVIKKAMSDNKKSADRQLKEEKKTEKQTIRQLCNDIILVHQLISKNYIVTDCQKCNGEKFVLIDVNSSGTGIELQCETCEKKHWLKIIDDAHEPIELNTAFYQFTELDPFYYYQYLTAYMDFKQLPKSAQKEYKKELPLMEKAYNLLDVVRQEETTMDMESIEVFQISFYSTDFDNTEIKDSILDILSKNDRMGVSEINQRLGSSDVDTVRIQCESLFIENKINRTKNYRYYIQSPSDTKAEESQSDTTNDYTELKELKMMLDDGLITKEDYEKKKKEILGL